MKDTRGHTPHVCTPEKCGHRRSFTKGRGSDNLGEDRTAEPERTMEILSELIDLLVPLLVALIGWVMMRLEKVVKSTKTQLDDNAIEALADWGVEYKNRRAAITQNAVRQAAARVDTTV